MIEIDQRHFNQFYKTNEAFEEKIPIANQKQSSNKEKNKQYKMCGLKEKLLVSIVIVIAIQQRKYQLAFTVGFIYQSYKSRLH